MFYSQTFLAPKGPLGTVWCAAHLQHRLKKSHYTSTDISSTVDRIMFPEVPIALRMSGHLLLGVVRIYSKKVDYLHHDSNVVLISLSKAFSNIDLNLPEDAAQAPVHSITLPERFDLDALELDDYIYDDGHDHYLRSREDITLTDQIPTGENVYVAITFDEDIMTGSSVHQEEIPSGVSNQREVAGPSNQTEVVNATMDPQDPGATNQREVATDTVGNQDFGASNQTEEQAATVDFPEPGPSNQTEVFNVGRTVDSSPQNFEVMRGPVYDISPGNIPPLYSDNGDVATEQIVPALSNKKEIHTPNLEDVSPSGGQSFESQLHSEAPPSAVLQEDPDMFDKHVSFEMVVRSTSPGWQQNPRGRKRKFFDESIVLSNALIKKGLEDASDLVRKRRNMPNSALGLWKFNNSLRKERIFQEPSITGLSADICNIFEKDYISSKPHLVVLEEANTGPVIVDEPAPETEAIPDVIIFPSPNGTAENIVESPSHITKINAESPIESPSHTNEVIPGTDDMPQTGIPIATDTLPTPDIGAFTGSHSEFETPKTLITYKQCHEYSGQSDIPESANLVEAGDLDFLEADNSTPGSHANSNVSVRSRAVARYLKKQSPSTPLSEDPPGHLSLNNILAGKTRKLCARMFFETLVLKSHGLIDVQQEQPYGDITLRMTHKLSKAHI